MEYDKRLPRLTRYLRSFTELDMRKPFDPSRSSGNIKNKISDTSCQGQLWSALNKKVTEQYGHKSEVYKNVIQLRNYAKELCGPDQQGEIIEETVEHLLKMFYKQKNVLNKHRSLLKQSFGDFPSSLPDKILTVINNLSEFILDEMSESLKSSSKNKTVQPQEIWGSDLAYSTPMYWEPPDTSFLSDMISSDTSIVDTFSMAYNGEPAESTKSATIKSSQTKPAYGTSWLTTEIRNSYNNDNPPGITAEELTESLVSMLSSERSNDQLQNELFDLLGFERFQLIETLLQHRKEIMRKITIENERKNQMLDPKAGSWSGESKRFDHRLSQVVVKSEGEKQMEKQARKEEKKLNKYAYREQSMNGCEHDELDFDPIDLRNKRIATLSESVEKKQVIVQEKKRPVQKDVYPNVYDSLAKIKQQPGFICGVKMILPEDVERKDTKQYEEITIPASEPPPISIGNNLVPISSLDDVGQMAFSGIKSLNRIQSVVFETAYNTNENLLICAPTGAGKTNVALLTILHTVRQHIIDGVIKKQLFKIVYVAPMKALAAEMTANFSKRLACVGLLVRELTGDMQLTKTEMMETQLLVTTPEKWDVVTRKPTGDIALRKLVKLLIIDEVHLLHGDRGPVVEALVARTLRQVESSQSMIRIVGLSATLPNYLDVARFLKVNPQVGLFYFDSRFRPVPLKQTFIGVKGTKALQQNNEMDNVCYEKLHELVLQGHQVMVFVHARNATTRTAKVLIEMAQQKGHLKHFEPNDNAQTGLAAKAMSRAKSKQLGELFNNGFAIHHAGLLRSDRSLVEKYFGEGMVKVLVCTATLAWGVNLPAHAVIIKGTEIYDAKHGSFIDLGILDVLQIFGRAGRPQFDSSGHGTIITTHNKLSHYLSLLTNQFPIESNFISHLADNLNAEVSLGTISNVNEAVEWLSYTYLHVRMRLNPLVYGFNYQDVMDDPNMDLRRRELIISAAKSLDKAKMIRFVHSTNVLTSTDVGRTSSNFYIKYDTVEIFNDMLKPVMNEVDIFNMVSHAQEFQQLKVREDEMEELDQIMLESCEYEVTSGKENLHGKVNILMQAFLSRAKVNSFSLISDLSYITQNAVRILRALFEISLRKNYALLSSRLHKLALMMEHQMWDFETPFRQFTILNPEILEKIQRKDVSIQNLREMDTREIGIFLRHQKMAPIVKRCAWEFPLLDLSVTLHPITRSVLRVKLYIKPDFKWNDKFHGKSSEAFWIIVEEPTENHIYHSEYFLLMRKQVIHGEIQEVVMTMPLTDPMPPQYIIRATSDRWLGVSSVTTFSVTNLILPESHPPHTELLDLQPLPLTAFNNPLFESLYKFSHFNPIQTQIFHCLYHTDTNVLIGAPTGSGKTIVAEIAMFRVFTKYPGYKVVYVAPLKALVREKIDDWKSRLEKHLNLSVIELTGDVTPDAQAIARSDIIVTTPEKWDGVSRSWQTRSYVQRVALIILDEVHLLGEERGPVLEVIVSRANFISAHTERTLRIVALSTALANARDLANWLNIKQMGLYNFRPSVRPVPLEVHIHGFQGKHYCPRMATMNRPAYLAIQTYSPAQPTLIFVSSRRQTRLTALDLIAYLAAEDHPKQWLHMPEEEMDDIINSIKDSNLRLTLAFGIGLHHAGLQERDRKTAEELFLNHKIQVLVATGTLAWGVNLPAHLVIVKGTEYFDGKTKRYVDMPITDVLQMMGRAGRPQFDNEGIACIFVHDEKKSFYRKFLYEPFPVESSLLSVLPDHLSAEIVAGTINSKQEALDYLTWTYFFRRLLKNPTYYGLESLEPRDVNTFLTGLVNKTLSTLYEAGCVSIDEDGRKLSPTSMARIAAYYYLSYQTMLHFESKLKSSMSLEDCLYTLSFAYEYSQMPVRHNEELLNGDLSKHCPLPVDQLSLDSPHIKTYLLLQAYFSRLDLPSTDYYTDLKSVLDQAFRILQGMIDVVGESGYLAVTLRLQTMTQMLSQGRWFTDSPLTQFIEPYEASQLSSRGLTMPRLVHAAAQSYKELAKCLLPILDEGRIQQIYEVAKRMPTLRVSLSLIASSGGESVRLSATNPAKVLAHEEYLLSVNLERYPRLPVNGPGRYAYTPRFHKPKTEGWFLTLGHSESAELIAMRRLPGPHRRTGVQLTFTPPSSTNGIVTLTLYIISDTYLGLDQQYDFQLDVNSDEPLPQYSLF